VIFRASLTALTGDIDLAVYRGTGQPLATSLELDLVDEHIDRALEGPMDLVVVVTSFTDQSGAFTLDVTAEPDHPNYPETAELIEPGQIEGSIPIVGDVDAFRIELQPGATLTATLSGLTADLDLVLIDNDGETIASSTLEGTVDDEIIHTAPDGGYFVVEVLSYLDEVSSYVLKLGVAAAE